MSNYASHDNDQQIKIKSEQRDVIAKLAIFSPGSVAPLQNDPSQVLRCNSIEI